MILITKGLFNLILKLSKSTLDSNLPFYTQKTELSPISILIRY